MTVICCSHYLVPLSLFPYDRPDRPNRSSSLKMMIRTTETIGGFHIVLSNAPNTGGAWSAAMFLGPPKEFLPVLRKQAEHISRFEKEREPCGLLSAYSIDFAA